MDSAMEMLASQLGDFLNEDEMTDLKRALVEPSLRDDLLRALNALEEEP